MALTSELKGVGFGVYFGRFYILFRGAGYLGRLEPF